MKSFALLRTNTGLTTNVKVVVDSSYGLSLDSIDSIQELSVSKLKKLSFNKKNYYDELVPYFFKGFPAETAFAIKYEDDSDTMTDNFASQYDEIYQYGARNIVSNKDYSEEYEYFAPLHFMKGKLPKAFAIFRVDGPGMIKLDRHNVKEQIFDNLKAIKIFDLTKNTALGEWLDSNFINNQYFPAAPFEMNFEKLEFSQWNGIDFNTGGYTTKSLFMDDFVEQEKEIFEFEKFVFDGFKNSKIVYPNILNFSFLFDDTPADANGLKKWSINRYYGFYIDNMDLVKTMSPFRVPFIKSDAVVQAGNILYSPSGDPFMEGWSDSRTFYVEYLGEYYKVEKFVEAQKATVKPVVSRTPPVTSAAGRQARMRSKEAPIAIPVDRLSGAFEDFPVDSNRISSGTVIKEEITPTYVTKWRIISSIDLSGKQAMLNRNIGYVDSSTKVLKNYDNTDLSIDGFELADIWLIEIDGRYHSLESLNGQIKINSDYSFKFYENYYEYWINKADPSYTKRGEFIDSNGFPNKFKIYRLRLSDIKDFDDRIVDTEFSKFEYEMETELTDTEETKLYLNNLNSSTHPKELDDFQYKNKVVNIPVSSEYTANHETFKVIGEELSPIWRKNPVYCRWAFEDSLGANDYPYVLNNSIRFEDYNRSVNPFDPDPHRMERNLDYFYTINSATFSYLHHTLHVENNNPNGISRFYFDFEKYLGTDTYQVGSQSKSYSFDYFSWFFDRKTTFLSNKIFKNVKKHSFFAPGDNAIPNITLFRGLKFIMHDIQSVSRNSARQIESINMKTSNAFDGYKFSILLSHKNNGMIWDVIDEWKMDKSYKKAEVVVYGDILYRAKRDNISKMPVVTKNSLQVKALPYNLTDDWEIYINTNIPLFNPLMSQNRYYQKNSTDFLKSVVYNSGDYYYFNGYEKPVDFWNPLVAYSPNSRLLADTNGRIGLLGYSVGSIVLYRGDYYQSLIENNIYPPNYTQQVFEGDSWKSHWKKIDPIDARSARWIEISIWNPSLTYPPNSFIVHEDILYRSVSQSRNIAAGEEPGVSALWNRLYSLAPDTLYRYQPDRNPLIKMNNEYYQIIANPWDLTLENGINIYINKKWKNVLVNIAINDNTITGLSNTNRDDLYVSLNKKLTAMNFVDCINNLSNKHGFTDYLNYIIIEEDGSYKSYNFENVESLPCLLTAEKPEDVEIKVNSLKIKKKEVTNVKATKVLEDGKITDIGQIDYFNKTHIATTIDANLDAVPVMKNLHGGTNITTDLMFRFSGNYFPLFYDIELFKRDNSTEYNEMQIALDLDFTQDLIFNFERNGIKSRKLYTIYPGASYSYSSSTLFTAAKTPPRRPMPIDEPATNRVPQVLSILDEPPTTGLDQGSRYIIGANPTGSWAGTYSVAGTSSVFQKKNSITEYVVGYLNTITGIISGSTVSIPGWNISTPLVSTWSYYPPKKDDLVLDSSTGKDLIYDGSYWLAYSPFSQPVVSKTSDFVAPEFYNQIRDIILSESVFSGVDFIFETHPRDAQYVEEGLFQEYGKYDRLKEDKGLRRNYNILSVKYKSSYGSLKLDIERQRPYIIMNIADSSLSNTDLIVELGATGYNPPFQWSLGYTYSSSYNAKTFVGPAYSPATTTVISDPSSANWIFDVKVIDGAGVTSSQGHYVVNGGNTFSFNGTFSYVSQ